MRGVEGLIRKRKTSAERRVPSAACERHCMRDSVAPQTQGGDCAPARASEPCDYPVTLLFVAFSGRGFRGGIMVVDCWLCVMCHAGLSLTKR